MSSPKSSEQSSQNAVSEQTVGGYTQAMTSDAAAQLERELGAFEITAHQRALAKNNEGGYKPLDAGRGNPNWINTKARYAFTRLLDFATSECQLDMQEGDMAGHGQREGISERFDAAMDPSDEIDKFLIDAVAYCVNDLGLNDVYGTFVENFHTVYSVLPYNTILVYSYSKLYGATGWRTGLVAMNKDNVVDHLIANLPDEERLSLEGEYAIVTNEPEKLTFIDRMCADSRSIGLYHTSGLATPAQIFMDLLSLTHLVSKNADPYIEQSKGLVNERYEALMNTLGLPVDESRENARYYTVIDVNKLMTSRYGEDFTEWRKAKITDIDLLNDLAQKKGVVLMYGPGFEAPEGCVRVSLANLDKDDYVELARRLGELLGDYYERYEEETQPAAAA